ncbi:MAG: AAA family ATPase [Actinomycetota bacterium]|nr:AAA family ATPase [Actinomycetota bacterium]
MKIAVAGKGGAGKSTVAGALIRHLAEDGHVVVALDADPNPNLGISIGVVRETVEGMEPILNALLDAGFTHNDPQPPAEDLLARYGVAGPDGIVLVATGKVERPSDACLCCGSHNITRQFFGELFADDRIVVADLEAGLNDLIWARPAAEDVVLAVSDGSAKAVEIARRACRLADEMGVRRIVAVANRSTGLGDAERLAKDLDLAEVVAVPEDPQVLESDHLGVAPFDAHRQSPAMAAVGLLAARLLASR